MAERYNETDHQVGLTTKLSRLHALSIVGESNHLVLENLNLPIVRCRIIEFIAPRN
jgi:hypothetical protein